MTSLRVFRTKEGFYDNMRMMKNSGRAIVLVEGTTDYQTLYRFIQGVFAVPDYSDYNKGAVVDAAKELHKMGFPHFIGIIDTDFDYIELVLELGAEQADLNFTKKSDELAMDNVFYTDSHDLDVDMFRSTAGEFLLRFMSVPKAAAFMNVRRLPAEKIADLVVDRIFDYAVAYGVLKLLLVMHQLTEAISVERSCLDSLEEAVHREIGRQAGPRYSRHQLSRMYEELNTRLENVPRNLKNMHLVTGHHLIEILKLGIVDVFGEQSEDFAAQTQRVLQGFYDTSRFRNTVLYRHLTDWTKHTGRDLLRT